MTKEQLEAEAAYADKIYRELSHPTPETRRKLHAAIKARRHSEAAALTPKPDA